MPWPAGRRSRVSGGRGGGGKTRRRARLVEGRHRRRVRQAQHEAARTVVDWAVGQRVGVLPVGDPRGVLNLRRSGGTTCGCGNGRSGGASQVLTDKADLAGITVQLVDERGTSSTCPACRRGLLKPAGRTLACPHCAFSGHRDLVAAAIIATRIPGGGPTTLPVAAGGGHAPSSRPAPARCRPIPT